MWQSRLVSAVMAAVGLLGNEALAQEEPGGAAVFAQGPIRRDEAAFRALYTVNRDGTNARYLVAAPGMISSGTPAWSHDGKMVAFDALAAVDDVERSQLFVYAVEGPFKGPVRSLGHGNTPSWSPDDRRIAFMLNDDNPLRVRGGVWLMDADGSNRRWLAAGWYPRWSPDGKRLCCHAWLPNGTASLFVIDAATGASQPLFQAGGWELRDHGGNWSPDGKRIVFVGALVGKDHLATIDANGAEDSIRVLYSNEDERRTLVGPPAWSPDGRQIIFAMQQAEPGPRQWWNSHLYSMAADVRSGPVLLEGTKIGNINRGMSWSPDGKQLIFSSER
jgi:Tol biopolymer transport system component